MTSNSVIHLGGNDLDTLQCQDGILIRRGVGLTMAQFMHAGGKVVSRVLNTGYSGPIDPKKRIQDFFSETDQRERTLDELYKADLGNLTKKHKQLLKCCHDLLRYALPECTVTTQLITFKILTTVITRYPGIRRLFLHQNLCSSPAASHFEDLWNRPHQRCGEEWTFYRDFAVYCLIDSGLTKLVESELPSNFGQLKLLEDNWNKDPIEILLSFCSADSPFNHEKICAIRYLAGFLDLPKSWRLKIEEGIDGVKRLFDFLSRMCETLFQLIRDTEASEGDSEDDASPLWTSARLAVDLLTFATFCGILQLHGLGEQLPSCPLQLSNIVSLLIRPKMEKSFPRAFGRAPQVKEILNWQQSPGTDSLRVPPDTQAGLIPGAHVDISKDEQLRFFYDSCALGALVDSNERYAAPQCSEFTRQGVIDRFRNWVNSGSSQSGIFWLYGAAGSGKSTLAQTLAQEFKRSGMLAASFFFRRSTAISNGDRLIPTLVYQLFEAFPGIQPIVEGKIRNIPDLFTKTRQTLMETLFIEPLISHRKAIPTPVHPLLIVIDGLDECQDPDTQCDLLKIIAEAIPQLPYPFRILIASRPVAHIVKTFNQERAFTEIRNSVDRYNLSDDANAASDIRIYLEQKFNHIRQSHALGARLQDWPDRAAVDALVDRSSNHFIYVSTAMTFIESPTHDPRHRLDVVLGRSIRRTSKEDRALVERLQELE